MGNDQIRGFVSIRFVNAALIGATALFGAATLVAEATCRRHALPPISETFDVRLQSIDSVNEAAAYVQGTHPGAGPAALADAADEFVRRRFFHSYAKFKPCENWLAFLAGYLWEDLRVPVIPDDILLHRRAACSQQAIVFQAIVRRFGLETGSVRMVGHFLSAVRIHGVWMVYDQDREITPRSYPLSQLLKGDPRIEQLYGKFGTAVGFRQQAGRQEIAFGDINANPAPQATLFHNVTRFFSHYGWAVFAAMFLALNSARSLLGDIRVRMRPALTVH